MTPFESAGAATVCIISPCFNEESVIGVFYRELKSEFDQSSLSKFQFRILFVDDGSSDSTLALLNDIASRDSTVTVLSLSRNFGHQIALSAGLDYASADAVILMDSDLQHPPKLIHQMVQLWKEGFDVVSAVRTQTADASPFKILSSSSFYRLFNFFSDTQILSGAADFCLLSARAHTALRSMPERHRFLRGMVSWIGFQRTTIAFSAPPRAAGTSKYTRTKMMKFAADAVFSFSARPIRLAARMGLMALAAAAVYFVYIMVKFFFYGHLVEDWASLIVVMLGLGGLQLLFIGLIGEYLARVFEESKRRPLYVLKQGPPAGGGGG